MSADLQTAPSKLPAPAADTGAKNPLTAFVRDQAEAVRVLREENVDEDREKTVSRRMDACHLAMRYLDTFSAGQTPTVQRVIEVAREFERFLLAP